jgi:hypothetical protein
MCLSSQKISSTCGFNTLSRYEVLKPAFTFNGYSFWLSQNKDVWNMESHLVDVSSLQNITKEYSDYQ